MGAHQSKQETYDIGLSQWNFLNPRSQYMVGNTCRVFLAVRKRHNHNRFHSCVQSIDAVQTENKSFRFPDPATSFPIYAAVTSLAPRWSLYFRPQEGNRLFFICLSVYNAPLAFDRYGMSCYSKTVIINGVYDGEKKNTTSAEGHRQSPFIRVARVAHSAQRGRLGAITRGDDAQVPYPIYPFGSTASQKSAYYNVVDSFLQNFSEDFFGQPLHILSRGARDYLNRTGRLSDHNLMKCQESMIPEVVDLLDPIMSLGRHLMLSWLEKNEDFTCVNFSSCNGRSTSCYYCFVGLLWTSDRPDKWIGVRDSFVSLKEVSPSTKSERCFRPTHARLFDAPSRETIASMFLSFVSRSDCLFYHS